MKTEISTTKLRKGDTVLVIAGKEKTKKGKISSIDHVRGRVIVEGVNMVKKTLRKTKEHPQGGMISREAPFALSNVMYFDENSGKASRLGWKLVDGAKKRLVKKSGKVID